MSIAFPLRTAACWAALVGGESPVRAQAARLLGAAGFDLSGAVEDGVIVLAATKSDAERAREIRRLMETYPDAKLLVVVPAETSNASLRRALSAGVAGIVRADEIESTLVPSVHAVRAGQLVVPMSLSREVAPQPLSYRERQILALVVEGLTNRQIADRLYLAESTVKTHLSSIFRKIDARSRAEAVRRVQDPESGLGLAILAVVDSGRTAA